MSEVSVKASQEGSTTGSATAPSDEPKAKRTVYIHVTFIKVGEIHTVSEKFDAEVMIRSRWRAPTLDGQDGDVSLENEWNPGIYIQNAVGEPQIKVSLAMEQNVQGEVFLVERKKFRGSFVELMELWDFPFDVQELSILIKSNTSISETQMVDETQEMHKIQTRSFMDEQEFYLYRAIESSTPPPTVDQLLRIVRQNKPSLKVTINVARLPHYFIWNIFLLMNILALTAFMSFGMSTNVAQARLQLTFGLVLCGVTFKSFVNAHVPKISYFSYLDVYVLVMIIVLAVICGWHGIMTRVSKASVVFVDYTGLVCLCVLYTIFHIVFIAMVLAKPYKRRHQMQQKEKEYEKKLSEELRLKTQQRKSQPKSVA